MECRPSQIKDKADVKANPLRSFFIKENEENMSTYETELGYVVEETLRGLEVYEDGELVCELSGKTLENYREDDGLDIDDDKLEADIKEELDVEDFLNYQKEYC